jgi:site-specific recombinase XerD
MSSFQLLIEAWTAALEDEDRSAHTVRAYTRAVADFGTWYETTRHMALAVGDLTPIDGKAYRTHLQARKLAPATINQAVAALRVWGEWLTLTSQRTDNPFRRLTQIDRKARLAPQALNPTQAHALLREAQDGSSDAVRNYALIQILLQTGLRRSECAALDVGDVLIGERFGSLLVRSGKGQASRRVPLNASARLALAEYLGPRWGMEPTIKALAERWPARDPQEPLWMGQRGRLTDNAIGRIVDGLVVTCAARELVPPDTSAHTLRHTFATTYLASHPGDMVGLAALMGHSSLDTTRIYTQPSDEDLSQRVEGSALNAYD